MNEFFTQFKTKARATKLSHEEKQRMRVHLYTYLERNPIGERSVSALSPIPLTPSSYHFFSFRYAVPVFLLLLITFGTGTVFAARGSLPGNPLYAIKIHINEPVQVALAKTPAAKAEVNASIATTRLEEGETLAANGNLTAATADTLAANFTAHAQAAKGAVVAIQSTDPGTAAKLSTDFTATLAAHGALLAQIGDTSSSTETTHNSNTLALAVQQDTQDTPDTEVSASSVPMVALATTNPAVPVAAPATAAPLSKTARTMRVQSLAVVAPQVGGAEPVSLATTTPSPPPIDPAVTVALGEQASSSIAQATQDFLTLQPVLDASTSAKIEAQLVVIQNTYAAGDYAAAIRKAVTLDVYLRAGKTITIKLLPELLSTQGDSN